MHLGAEPDALDLARGFRQELRFIGAIEPQHARDGAGTARKWSDRDIFQHGHVGHQLDVLKGARHAEPGDVLRRRVDDRPAEQRDLSGVESAPGDRF